MEKTHSTTSEGTSEMKGATLVDGLYYSKKDGIWTVTAMYGTPGNDITISCSNKNKEVAAQVVEATIQNRIKDYRRSCPGELTEEGFVAFIKAQNT